MTNFRDIAARFNRQLTRGAIGIGLVGLATAAFAVPIGPPSPTIVSGDKTFFNFTCNVSVSIIGVVTCADLAINVDAHTSTIPPDPTSGDFGIRITGNMFALIGTSTDIQLGYQAHTDGSHLFHDASMFYNGTVVTSVVETIQNLDPTSPFYLQTISFSVANPGSQTADILLPWDVVNIGVSKDIGLSCLAVFGCTGQANISIIDQQFSQVPEPGSLALLASALVGAGWFGRRRNNRS